MTVPYNRRTHTCGQLRAEHVNAQVVLVGWVHSYRDHGGMVFIDLRDHDGLTQIKFNPQTDPTAHQIARTLRMEDCVAIAGDVAPRGTNVNPKLPTGEIEVNGREIDILNKSETPIFEIADHIDVGEDLRLRYRFLDLRRAPLQRALRMRHRMTKAIRDYFDTHGFLEIETPFLTKSTPEGARDYLVPSRIQQGYFYALPQSPQLFKQLFMIGGMDRYMQIVRCFRDEDLRADRQPEFTQVDVEMAFVKEDDIIRVTEGAIAYVMREVMGVEVPLPMPRMTYAQAMRDYGTDRPDTRFGMKLVDISAIARKTDFNVFTGALEAGGVVRCVVCPGGGEMTRKETDGLTNEIKGVGAGGLPLTKVIAGPDGKPALQTGIAKFFEGGLTDELIAATGAAIGDAIFFSADTETNVCKYLAWLRGVLAQRRGLIPRGQFNFCWVVDFPLMEYSREDKRWYSMHHPFTSPHDEDIEKLESDPGSVRAKAYDVILNGVELGGGSIRIHRTDLQQRVFRVLGINEQEAHVKFEHLLSALKFGAPPHGGIALGLDRFVMLVLGLDSIRDVVAFPKTQRATCPLTNAPSEVDPKQLAELGIDLTPATKAKLTGVDQMGGPEHVHRHDRS